MHELKAPNLGIYGYSDRLAVITGGTGMVRNVIHTAYQYRNISCKTNFHPQLCNPLMKDSPRSMPEIWTAGWDAATFRYDF